MVKGAALPEPGDTVAEKYRIECTIGTGGMSVVYGATHVITGRRFAIKWMCPEPGNDTRESTQRFIREAQVAGRFAHPNVVEVYDVGQVDGAYFMVMEWLEGESLAARLDRDGPLSFSEACDLLIPCMYGIDDAHNAGIVHRDLKPANIFLCPATRHSPARAKVLDFGIAKLMDHARRDSSPEDQNGKFNPVVTQVGTLMGTPYYLAPEQLRNHPADARTDVYAFGVMLYQVFAGRVPFTGNSFADLVVQISSFTPRSLREIAPSLPARVEQVVARAMARDPDLRYQELRSLAGALESIQGAVQAQQEQQQLRAASSGRMRTSMKTAAGGVAVAAVDAIRTQAARFSAPPEPPAPVGLARPLSLLRSSGVQPVSRVRLPMWAWLCAGALVAALFLGIYKRWTRTGEPQQAKRPAALVSPRPQSPAATPTFAPRTTTDLSQAATAQQHGGGAALPRGLEAPRLAAPAAAAPQPTTTTVQSTQSHSSASPAARKKPAGRSSGLSLPDLPEPEEVEATPPPRSQEQRRAPSEAQRKPRVTDDDFDSEEDINPLQGMRLQ